MSKPTKPKAVAESRMVRGGGGEWWGRVGQLKVDAGDQYMSVDEGGVVISE